MSETVGERPKALLICGTRPDAIKMAPVARAFQAQRAVIDTVIAVTAQHRSQLDQVLDTFEIRPDYDLNIMQRVQSLSAITCRALTGLDEVFEKERPDITLAQGDTTTTFVASLASFYYKTPFGHVEAGLRTDNRFDPFPEEMNRRLTGVLAELHFAPTPQAEQRLLSEGVPRDRVFLTGNTVIDALLEVTARPHTFQDPRVSAIAESGAPVLLVTLHRRENWGEPMRRVCQAIGTLLDRFENLRVIFPMHLNPRVREVVEPELGSRPRVLLIEPQEYAPMAHLMKLCTLVLTDSGGIQEEAPSLGKPVLVARETTERPEGVEAGAARLVGADPNLIVEAASEILTDPIVYDRMSHTRNPYGDGRAAERICRRTLDFLRSTHAHPIG
ncbi:MAG TPA: UDP-N-acetylglucosamine 2-epimerase (non-hydrolyzing) [Armatimonadota bacterium]|nr:UDP-N-acetylglucosamine 2-epimerase (non-hydrolyzing) [Armatimonadota bacterium]